LAKQAIIPPVIIFRPCVSVEKDVELPFLISRQNVVRKDPGAKGKTDASRRVSAVVVKNHPTVFVDGYAGVGHGNWCGVSVCGICYRTIRGKRLDQQPGICAVTPVHSFPADCEVSVCRIVRQQSRAFRLSYAGAAAGFELVQPGLVGGAHEAVGLRGGGSQAVDRVHGGGDFGGGLAADSLRGLRGIDDAIIVRVVVGLFHIAGGNFLIGVDHGVRNRRRADGLRLEGLHPVPLLRRDDVKGHADIG